jgi:hypothetical protein
MAKTPQPPVKPVVEEAPILPGYENDESLDTVTLTGGGSGDGTYRVSASLPHVILANGHRYVLSDRAAKIYAVEAR